MASRIQLTVAGRGSLTLGQNEEIDELEIVQNPALGALAVWSFGRGHQDETADLPSFLAAFIVLPIVLHRETLDIAASTQRTSGLGLFAAKLGEQRERLLALHDRAILLRSLTLRSIILAAESNLISISYERGLVRSNDVPVRRGSKYISEFVRPLLLVSEKLGHWVGRAGLQATASLLRVRF